MISVGLTSPFAGLIISVLLGACLGLERTFAGKTAGMRTYSLVSMGSCLFIMIAGFVASPSGANFSADTIRMAAGIVMGIGFLCGGVIIFRNDQLSGLTTAAGLWVAAGIGMAVGFGLTILAVFATIATLVVFILFWFVEHMMVHLEERQTRSHK